MEDGHLYHTVLHARRFRQVHVPLSFSSDDLLEADMEAQANRLSPELALELKAERRGLNVTIGRPIISLRKQA